MAATKRLYWLAWMTETSNHVHMMISIPPKHSVSQVVGYIEGKSAIHFARVYGERKRNFVGQPFWARGTSCPRWAVMKV